MSNINKKRPIYVLDTNVLLYNPRAVYAFPNADVVIPDIVLGELDKVKTSRADRELRYRSREISRILFELSENGRLTDGIPFGKNSVIRVMSFDPNKARTDIFGGKNSDDKILAIVDQMKRETSRQVTIVTNDLNMLLKAQTLGVKVEHPGEEFAYSGVKRLFFKVKAKKKPIWSTFGVAAAIALIVFIQQNPDYIGLQSSRVLPEGPPELVQSILRYQNELNAFEAQRDVYMAILKKDPKDLQALINLGNIYYDLGETSKNPKNFQQAVDYYKKALDIDPKQLSVRTDMAVAYNFLGANDIAIRELKKVTSMDGNFYQAYFNLGVILFQAEGDLDGARECFQKVAGKAPRDSRFRTKSEEFIREIDEIKARSAKGG